MISIFLALALLQEPIDEKVAVVREGYLDISRRERVGKALETYPWFIEFSWRREDEEGRVTVVFEGRIRDEDALKTFEERHKYKLRSNLKAMQLETVYDLSQERDMLSFIIYFEINPDESFQVVEGFLGIRDGPTHTWRTVPLSDKALLFVVKGFYADRDPYMSLVRGLPFK